MHGFQTITNRKQYVKVGNAESSLKTITNMWRASRLHTRSTAVSIVY